MSYMQRGSGAKTTIVNNSSIIDGSTADPYDVARAPATGKTTLMHAQMKQHALQTSSDTVSNGLPLTATTSVEMHHLQRPLTNIESASAA